MSYIEQKQNWESRIETMNALYKRFIETASRLDPNSAIAFTSPMAELFINGIEEMEKYYEAKKDALKIV